MMDGLAKTAQIAAYLDAIDAARRTGFNWRHIHGKLADELGIESTEIFRQLVVRARKAVASGRYAPDQLPFPGEAAPARTTPRQAAQTATPAPARATPQPTSTPAQPEPILKPGMKIPPPRQTNLPPGRVRDISLPDGWTRDKNGDAQPPVGGQKDKT